MKRYAAGFFMVLLVFGIVSCDDSGGADKFELIGTWKRTITDGTDTMNIYKDSMAIIREKNGSTGLANFNMSEYDNAANSFKAVCTTVSDADNVFQDFWTGLNTIYYFAYSVENDGMYYNKQEGTYPGTWTIGPCVKQAEE